MKMECKVLLGELLDNVGTKKFGINNTRFFKNCNDDNKIDLYIGDSYFYNRLSQKYPIIADTKTYVYTIYESILKDKTGYSSLAVSENLNKFFLSEFKIDTSCFVLFHDDNEKLRKEKINSWLVFVDILLSKAQGRKDVEFEINDFREVLERQQKAIEKYCAGTHTEIILNDKAETSEIDDRMKEFHCGLYYCYYVASDADRKIRGGKLRIYNEGSKLKVKLILRISDDYLLDDEKLNEILNIDDSFNSYVALKNYKEEEYQNSRYESGRCEVYTGDFKAFRNYIRIDLRHAERGYSGFIILHKMDSTTQRKLQGCLAYLMNIPDSNSIYIRKLGISSYKFSLCDESLWKYIGIPADDNFMEISKSHKDNNHLFYTFVWEKILESLKDKATENQ